MNTYVLLLKLETPYLGTWSHWKKFQLEVFERTAATHKRLRRIDEEEGACSHQVQIFSWVCLHEGHDKKKAVRVFVENGAFVDTADVQNELSSQIASSIGLLETRNKLRKP
ncbi:hypothetical protein HN51_017815 [Arachis hypogaea]|nr:uncharacterized protein DS421_8g224250 [Arachis hypogaea]